jgi:hypothetical protein
VQSGILGSVETRDTLALEGRPSTRNAKTEDGFPHPDKEIFYPVFVGASHRTEWTGVVTNRAESFLNAREEHPPSRQTAD